MTHVAHMPLLLVQGSGDGREETVHALALAGYGDVLRADSDRTLELCVTERPDLVLLDLDAGTSRATLESIRHLTDSAHSLPVLALSSNATIEVRRWALSNGVRDFVAKPIDETEL